MTEINLDSAESQSISEINNSQELADVLREKSVKNSLQKIKEKVKKIFVPEKIKKNDAFLKYLVLFLVISSAVVLSPSKTSAQEESDFINKNTPTPTRLLFHETRQEKSAFEYSENQLHSEVERIINSSPGEWNVMIAEVGGETVFSHQELEPFHPGSTIKVHIGVAVIHFLEQNSNNLDTKLDSIVPQTSHTWRELLKLMIIDSDEVATETIVNTIGVDKIDSILENLGYSSTTVRPRRSTSLDLTNVFEDLALGEAGISQQGADLLLSFLNKSAGKEIETGSVLPDSELNGHYHKRGIVVQDDLIMSGDTAFISLQNGKKYIVSVTGTFKDRAEFQATRHVIPEISQKAYDFFDNDQAAERMEKINNPGSGFQIDAHHANIGRLFNLLQVKERLDGRVLQPGETLSFNEAVSLHQAQSNYMNGITYTASGVSESAGGGVCGAASALGTEASKVGLGVSFDGGNHFVTDHSAGGLYYGLENISVAAVNEINTDLRIINTSAEPITIRIDTNYDYQAIGVDPDNWQQSADLWDTFLPPTDKNLEAYTFSIHFESNGEVVPYQPVPELIKNWPLNTSFSVFATSENAPEDLKKLPAFAVDIIETYIETAVAEGTSSRNKAFEEVFDLWQFSFPDGDTNPSVRSPIQKDIFNAMYGGNENWTMLDVWNTWKDDINQT